MVRFLISALIALACIYAVAIVGAFAAEPAPVCDPTEIGQLRFLVQLYGRQRTDAEFALARAETQRQALEREVKRLIDELAKAAKPGG